MPAADQSMPAQGRSRAAEDGLSRGPYVPVTRSCAGVTGGRRFREEERPMWRPRLRVRCAFAALAMLLPAGPAAAQVVILHSFTGGAADGKTPFGSLTLSGSTLYGMTAAGGTAGPGTVFQIG